MKNIAMLVIILSTSIFGYGQQKDLSSEVMFRIGASRIEVKYKNNKQQLDTIVHVANDTINNLLRIKITSYNCPINGKTFNDELSKLRSKNLSKYLSGEIFIPKGVVIEHSKGIDWDGLEELVENSNMKHKDKVLDILYNVPEETWRRKGKYNTLIDSRNKHLMDLEGGRPYRYMMKHIFPLLRSSSVITLYYEKKKTVEQPAVLVKQRLNIEEVKIPTPTWVLEMQIPIPPKIPLFAIKTNIIYNLALTPNIEVEVPMGTKWSMSIEVMCGWWLKEDNSFCWQIQSFGMEGRYWFASKKRFRPLTGWFMGAFANVGLYDFQFEANRGRQGEYIVAGMSGGYCLPVTNNFSIELSVGIGYVVNDYRNYYVRPLTEWDSKVKPKKRYELIKEGSERRLMSIVPAKAKISLVWMFNHTKKEGGDIWID